MYLKLIDFDKMNKNNSRILVLVILEIFFE